MSENCKSNSICSFYFNEQDSEILFWGNIIVRKTRKNYQEKGAPHKQSLFV